MEVLHLIRLTVVVTVTAVVHAYPYHTVDLFEPTARVIVLGGWYHLFKVLLVALLDVQAVGAVADVAEPEDTVTVEIDGQNTHTRRLPQLLGILPVGIFVDGTALAARVDVITVGVEGGDFLVLEDSSPLNAQIGHVNAVQALVSAHPDVVVIAFGHRVYLELRRGNQLCRGLVLVEVHTVDAHTFDGNQHVAIVHGEQ